MGVNFQADSAETFFGMKLLLVHPDLSDSSSLAQAFRSAGVTVFVARSEEEARQLLSAHSSSLELAVLHREPFGLDLISFIRATPSLADLPYVLTSSEWSDEDFVRHQESVEGANAYLRFEDAERDLRFVVEQVLGYELGSAAGAPPPVPVSESTALTRLSRPAPSIQEVKGIQVEVEDATSVFTAASVGGGSTSFKLEVDLPQLSSNEPVTPPSSQDADGATRVLSRDAVFSEPKLDDASESSGIEIVLDAGESQGFERLEAQPKQQDEAQPKQQDEAQPVEVPAVELRPDEFKSDGFTPDPGSMVELPVLESTRVQSDLEVGLQSVIESRQDIIAEPEPEPDLASEMPYLFGGTRPRPSAPVGDAVVPGGASQTPDIETLKRYLALREQDVATLSAQLHEARNHIRKLEEDLRQSHALMEEQDYQLKQKARREQEFEREKALVAQGLQAEMDEIRFQMKARADKARALESQVRETTQEMERMRERVRNDFRRIRVREKELENRLDLVKRDSEALLLAREGTILELKRKLDTAEFNLDLLHDRLAREKDSSDELREKLLRASQAVRLAGGLLDPADADAALQGSAAKTPERSERKVS